MSGGDGVAMVTTYCREVSRVLSDGGRFIVITHQDPETEAALGVLENAILPGLTDQGLAEFPSGERTGDSKKKRRVEKKTDESSSNTNRCWWSLDVHSMVTNLLATLLLSPYQKP